jgi:hypothetical protein
VSGRLALVATEEAELRQGQEATEGALSSSKAATEGVMANRAIEMRARGGLSGAEATKREGVGIKVSLYIHILHTPQDR